MELIIIIWKLQWISYHSKLKHQNSVWLLVIRLILWRILFLAGNRLSIA